jgi:hypothetical protein
LICDDKATIEEAPPASIAGDLRDRLQGCGFTQSDFPSLKDVFAPLVQNAGRKEHWGRAPLSIPQQHHPSAMPLYIAYRCREMVDKTLAPLGDDTGCRLRATTAVLARAVCETRKLLARKVAVTLALETVNGMAKTAPMTDAPWPK